jgi:hypothetical protein
VIVNLISVARREGAAKIALVSERNGVNGILTIAGSGLQLGPELVSSLRVDQPIDPQDPTQLALSVARHLVRAMGGRITHHATDDMTLLTLELPLAERKAS